MAGTISIFGTQQFKPSGAYAIPLSGGRLYTIAAGTTSDPQNVYQDVGLTIAHPNPITLDESGFVPPAYAADGYLKYRLTDADGVTIREYDNQMVVGPSSGEGGGGGGGGVDSTTVFATGDVMWQPVSGSRTGWVRDNGRSIGSSTSGATERANADCESLFSFLWNKYSDTFCPVSTGRGVSAAADWSSNKTITLLDFRGCAPGGLPDMGTSEADVWDDVPVVTGDTTTAGSVLGGNTTTLVTDNLPPYTPDVTLNDDGHHHTYTEAFFNGTGASPGGAGGFFAGSRTSNTSTATTGITLTIEPQGGASDPVNNVQRTVLGTFYRKL